MWRERMLLRLTDYLVDYLEKEVKRREERLEEYSQKLSALRYRRKLLADALSEAGYDVPPVR